MSSQMNEERSIFYGMSILFQDNWLQNYAVIVEGKKIKAIIPAEMIEHHLPAKKYFFSSDYYLLPGLIDLHVHGIQGWDVMDSSEEAFKSIAHALAAQGVTGFLATTMTAENKRIESLLRLLPNMVKYEQGAAVLGVHLEGPFLAKEKIGAQSASLTQLPNIDLIEHWQKISGEMIRIITLAPELPDALKLIHFLNEKGIIASIGHTQASYAETCSAITAGCRHATHLFNAMRGLHQREPGATGALLLANEVIAELIVDGVHVHPAVVELAWRLKGKQRLMLVTDAMRAACLGNGQYELGGQMVNVENGKAVLSDGTLAGSTLTMTQAMKHMMEFTRVSLIDAVYMAAHTPAAALKLNHCKGSIEVGKDADLMVMHTDFTVALTMREGKEVFSKT